MPESSVVMVFETKLGGLEVRAEGTRERIRRLIWRISQNRAAKSQSLGLPWEASLEQSLRSALRGESFTLPPLDDSSLSAHTRRVLEATSDIPFGETRTYGDIALQIQSGPRAVGGALSRNPFPILIPCHRVLARSGLGGYSVQSDSPTDAASLSLKRFLLSLEGSL